MKKIILLVVSLCLLFALTACGQPEIIGYHIDENGKLIATYEDNTTADLGTLTDTIANGANTISVNSDGFYVINGVVSKIEANLPESYEVDTNGNLIVTYTDTTTKNLGKFGNDAINTIDTIAISDDGFYVLNGIKTSIVAVNVFDVNFVTGYDATVKTQIVKDGDKVIRPQLEREGYTLKGWYCNGEEWRFNSDVVLNEMTLTAEWIANDYTVSFNTGIADTLPNQTITFETEYSLPILERTGYTFKGWEYNSKLVTADKWNIAENATLVAKWEVNKYKVTLNANGGTVAQLSVEVTYGEMYNLPVPTNDFGQFKGWYYNQEKITDEYGNSLEAWVFDENITVTTTWITEIYTLEDLLKIKEALNGHYVLMADLDVSNIDWMPIGNIPESLSGLTSDNFTGVIDGNGYTINGLTMTTYFESLNSYGFVGYNYGTLKNLKLTNVNINITGIQNDVYAGGICGYNSGDIVNCYVSGKVNISNHSGSYDSICGGIVGKSNSVSMNEPFKYSIIDCYNEAEISSANYAGGIVGFSIYAEPYQKCINAGNVTSKYAGGIVGYSYGDNFYQCKNEGNINGSQECGGILGATMLDSYSLFVESSFIQCANIGEISTSNSADCEAGGIVGEIFSALITDCYNYGKVSGHSVAGIMGHSSCYTGTIVSNCLNTGVITGNQYSAGIIGCGTQIEVKDCVNFGKISTSISKGHISGYNYAGTHANCYYVYQSGTFNDADASGIAKTTLSITDTELYTDYLYWDVASITNIDGIWIIDGTNHPCLSWELPEITE